MTGALPRHFARNVQSDTPETAGNQVGRIPSERRGLDLHRRRPYQARHEPSFGAQRDLIVELARIDLTKKVSNEIPWRPVVQIDDRTPDLRELERHDAAESQGERLRSAGDTVAAVDLDGLTRQHPEAGECAGLSQRAGGMQHGA